MSGKAAVIASLCLGALMATSSAAWGQTHIPGGDVSYQTWTPAGSPYIIYGDVVVGYGGSLVIEAGTVITFMASDLLGTGLDPNRVEFTIMDGSSLHVYGDPLLPVTFRAESGPGPDVWYGIIDQPGAGALLLANVTISDAVTGLTVQSVTGVASIDDVTFATNSTDLFVDPGGLLYVQGTLTATRVAGLLDLYDGATFRLGEPDGFLDGEFFLDSGANYRAAVRSLYDTDHLQVTGPVTLGGNLILDTADLQVFPGSWVYLIANDGTDPTDGVFAGLPEGSVWADGGRSFGISYRGGTGNDVVLMVDPAPWPDESQWEPVVDRSSDAFRLVVDPAGDVSAPEYDLVGDANDPVAYLATDDDYYFLRIRLAASPLANPLRYASVVVRVLLEFVFHGGPVSYDYDIQFSGIDETLTVRRNSQQSADWCNDLPEDDVLTYFVPPRTFGDVRILPAGTAFGGAADHFIDMRIVRREWDTSVGPAPVAAPRIVIGTATNPNQINRDTAGLACDQSWSDGMGDVPGRTLGAPVLHQNTPNPFNPRTTIRFELPAAQRVSLGVHDLAGRLVCTLVADETLPAGPHARVWDGRDAGGRTVAAGAYLYRLVADGVTATKRMALIK